MKNQYFRCSASIKLSIPALKSSKVYYIIVWYFRDSFTKFYYLINDYTNTWCMHVIKVFLLLLFFAIELLIIIIVLVVVVILIHLFFRCIFRRPRRTHQIRGLLRQIPYSAAAVPMLVQVYSQPQKRSRRQHRQQHDEESFARIRRLREHNELHTHSHTHTSTLQ